MISQLLKINNKKLKRNKLYISIRFRLDIFGNVIRLKRINRSFKYVYFKYYRKLIKKPLNIFFKLRVIVRMKYMSKKFRHVLFRKKYALLSFYHNIKLHQLRKFYINSKKLRGNLISNFITKLETRLDMFIYRAFNLLTLPQIKQFIHHGKVFVNSKKVTYTSFNLEKYDIISFFDYNSLVARRYSMFDYAFGVLNIFKNFIIIYKLLLAKATRKDRKYLICKNPKYMEVFNPLLLAIFIEDRIKMKDVPFFFSVKPHDLISLF